MDDLSLILVTLVGLVLASLLVCAMLVLGTLVLIILPFYYLLEGIHWVIGKRKAEDSNPKV